ncbi:uncharacterized protein LOC125776711 [Bactrocera dorsalis]|uniref:Uncharacterized protein LOC125776711 n=1 Tax=Bactrocera dorsalis TaxID=27457 RepID=A0ABM3JAE9_BACDO|nr:uncharacterized protein LOC125776711 [Bactrocera dorsalis]
MDTDKDEIFDNLTTAICENISNMSAEPTPTPDKKRKRFKVTMAWSSEDVFNLIEIMEKHPCLWEYSSSDYKNRQKRENAWREVAANCHGRSVDECKAKWANVKTAYNNTKNKLQAKSGQSASSSQPHWQFWTAMQFYHNHDKEKTTSSVSNISPDSESLPNTHFQPINMQSNASTSSPADAATNSPEDILKRATDLLYAEKEDKWYSFGMYIASQMREMNAKNEKAAKKLEINIMKCTIDALSELNDD